MGLSQTVRRRLRSAAVGASVLALGCDAYPRLVAAAVSLGMVGVVSGSAANRWDAPRGSGRRLGTLAIVLGLVAVVIGALWIILFYIVSDAFTGF